MSFIGPALESVGGALVEGAEALVSNEIEHMIDEVKNVVQQDIIEPVEHKLQANLHDYFRATKKRKFFDGFEPQPTGAPTQQPANMQVFQPTTKTVPATKPLGYGSKGSFANILMAYKRRYSGYSRRRRYKRRKYTTKRGVKSLIANYANQAGSWFKNQYSITQGFNSDFGLVARGSQYFNTYSDMNGYDTIVANAQGILATGGTDEPRSGNHRIKVRNNYVETLIHSNINEYQFVNVWLMLSMIGDTGMGPVTRWATEYGERMPVSTGITGGNCPFPNNFMTYPTEFPQFRREWKIKKKWSFMLAPGQTAKLKYKLKNLTITLNDLVTTENVQPGFTSCFMIELKGVPTHQNDGMAQNLDTINRSRTGVDVIHDVRMQLCKVANTYSYLQSTNLRETVAAGQSIVASTPAVLNWA